MIKKMKIKFKNISNISFVDKKEALLTIKAVCKGYQQPKKLSTLMLAC